MITSGAVSHIVLSKVAPREFERHYRNALLSYAHLVSADIVARRAHASAESERPESSGPPLCSDSVHDVHVVPSLFGHTFAVDICVRDVCV